VFEASDIFADIVTGLEVEEALAGVGGISKVIVGGVVSEKTVVFK
jgi:hypothetical protein